MNRDPHAPPEVLGVFTKGGATEVPQYHLMIKVVPVVMDRNVPEEMVVRPQDVFHPGLYLPTHPEHTTLLPALTLMASEWQEVRLRVLQ